MTNLYLDGGVYSIIDANTDAAQCLQPTSSPTYEPTYSPTLSPTFEPTASPTSTPTYEPTAVPTTSPSLTPTLEPTATPTLVPTFEPTAPTAAPTFYPTTQYCDPNDYTYINPFFSNVPDAFKVPGTFTSRRKLNGYTQGCCPYSPGPVTITPGVTSIPAAAFAGCVTLTSVTLPDTLTDIGDFAFVECIALTTLVIPEGVYIHRICCTCYSYGAYHHYP